MSKVPECVFSGYLDLEVGMMIGAQGTDFYTDTVIDNLAAAVINMFESSHSISIEGAFRQATGREHELEPYFRELAVATPGHLHVFVRADGNDNRILCVVSNSSAGAKAVLDAARSAAGQIEKAAGR